MSWLGWGSATNPQYEELVEKTCSALNLPFPQSENMADILEVTDLIRSKAVQPKPAMQSLKRRVTSPNGRVQMYALSLTDACIKNGGDHFLVEVASKEFVDELSKLIKSSSTTPEVKQMALRLFQQWAVAFRDKRDLSFLVDVYNELKNSGTPFPAAPTQTSSHLFSTITAPEWVDSDVCMRCRTAFTFTNRKHHCRNCGLVFDQACSSKTMELPHFGITTPVRVCDSCYVKGGKPIPKVPAGPPPAVPGRTPRSRADFDADLQRAIELSLADSRGAGMVGSEPPMVKAGRNVEDDDEELRLAIEASLREMEARPSAPNGYDEPEYKPLPTFDLNPRETETILTFSNTLDQMAAYGERDLRRFPHAHVLYEQAYGIGGKLHRNVEEKTTKQQMLAEMQDKLSQAVAMYGQVLDGQQAYTAQRLQEQQQRQYYAQSQPNPYSQQYQPPQQASPYGYQPPHQQPYSNGYAPSPYAYAPPSAPTPAAPGLYPSMPPAGQAAPTPSPYAPAQQQYASPSQAYPAQIPQQYEAPQTYTSAPQQYPQQPYLPQAQHYQLQRVTSGSYAASPQAPYSPSAPSAPSAPARSLSSSYTSDATPIAATPVPMAPADLGAPSAPNALSTSPAASIHGSAPPVDMASHPSISPRSDTVALPSQPQGVQRSTSFIYAQQAPQQQAVSPQRQKATLLQQPIHQQPQQQPNGPVYYETSFPPAPAAVFPDAPADEPDKGKVAQEQPKEAMLIEL